MKLPLVLVFLAILPPSLAQSPGEYILHVSMEYYSSLIAGLEPVVRSYGLVNKCIAIAVRVKP